MAAVTTSAASLLLAVHVAVADPTPPSPPPTTSPPSHDSDGDGLSDIEEDPNQNGIVDEGESDPRSADTDEDNVPDQLERQLGTDPASAADLPSIPEPLYIDLIRNLGSRRGELEANVLATTRFERSPAVTWGAEIEYVVARNLAVELELPMRDGKVEALKGGFQTRVASTDNRRLEVGLLGVGYHLLAERRTVVEPSAVIAVRFTPAVHGLTIVGPTASAGAGGPLRVGAMLHPSLFYQASRKLTFGLELGHRSRQEEGRASYSLPQVHLNVARRAKVQLGAGMAFEQKRVAPLVATRLSVEL